MCYDPLPKRLETSDPMRSLQILFTSLLLGVSSPGHGQELSTVDADEQSSDVGGSAATAGTSGRRLSDNIEEIIVTAPRPDRGKVPTYERVFQIYESRRKGASLYKQGKYEEAFPHLLAAARSGFKFAQARVGFLYQQGLGTPQDPYAAVGWLGLAAEGTSHPEIKNYLRDLWARIPEPYVADLEAVIDEYREKYSASANRVGCDMSRKAGTYIKKLTCRFMDEGIYQNFGELTEELGGSGPGGGAN